MKKVKLQSNVTYDFHLIGVISNAREYTVCWSINQTLNIKLKKEDDVVLIKKNGERQMVSYSLFENDFIRYSLISNRVDGGDGRAFMPLLSALSHFDYFLKIEVLEEVEDLNSIYGKLREAARIDSILKLDVKKVKEKESLIF